MKVFWSWQIEILFTSTHNSLTIYNTDGDANALYTLSQSLGWNGAILAVQLSRFIPSAFPEKSKYINTILREVINPSAIISLDQLETVTPDVSYLLGKPPLEHLWKVILLDITIIVIINNCNDYV